MSLLTSLISFWELEEASGARNDSHGTNHLTDNNTVTQNTGKVGNAAEFEKTNSEYLNIASNASIECGDIDFTWAFWFYTTETGAANYQALTKDGDGAAEDFAFVWRDGGAANNLTFFLWNASGTRKGVTSGVLATSTWHFIVGWHDAAADTMYLQINNGIPGSTAMAAANRAASAATLDFGRRQRGGGTDYFKGRLDQVALWKRVLTADERTALYNGGNGLSYTAMGASLVSHPRPHGEHAGMLVLNGGMN